MASWEDRYWTSSDGLRLHYRDYAGPRDRPPILCLPGLTRNARDFEPVAGRYAGEWRVIALDFRGRGMSDHDPEPERYVPRTYASDVLKLLDQLGIATAVFFGTSLGGLVTMVIAATDEERMAGAMLNDIGPEIDPRGIARIQSYVGRPARWPSWDEAARGIAEGSADIYPRWSPADWERHARRICREAGGEIGFDYDMAIAKPFSPETATPARNSWPLVEALAGRPVTVIRGALSDLFAAEVAERMVARIPGAELVTVPDVGHAPILDEAEAVAGIDRLLERVLAEAG